eukprot:gene32557-17276_t
MFASAVLGRWRCDFTKHQQLLTQMTDLALSLECSSRKQACALLEVFKLLARKLSTSTASKATSIASTTSTTSTTFPGIQAPSPLTVHLNSLQGHFNHLQGAHTVELLSSTKLNLLSS